LSGSYSPTVYDAGYLALAASIGCELWTADRHLVQAVGGALPWLKTVDKVGAS